MAWGGARRHACARELALLKRSASTRRSRPVDTPGEASVACAHDGALGRDIRGGEPRPRHLCSELVAAAPRRTRSKPELAFETQNHGRTSHCVLETHQKALLDASHHLPRTAQAPVQPGTGCLFHCRRDRLRTAAVRGGLSLDRCDRLLTEKGAATALRRRQSVNRFTRERRSDRNAVVLTNPTPSAVLVALPRDP